MGLGARTAAGLALCVVVTGCSGGPDDVATTLPPVTAATSGDPTTDATPTESTPTASTEPVPTTSADLGDEHVESVETTVLAFFDALNSAKDTGDFSAFDALYVEACTGCTDMRTEVQGWLANGQTVDGGNWVVMQQTSSLRSQGYRADVFFVAYRTSIHIRTADGSPVHDVATSKVQLGSAGLLSDAPWLLDGISYRDIPA